MGLQRLHTTIRNGFNDTLAPVQRQEFRSHAGVDDSLVLIPINFFLHNCDGHMSIDELVIQAIEYDHSIQFDRLALFALNLNRAGGGRDAGSGRDILPRPAMWANEFVREQLWVSGAWQADALSDIALDSFLEDRMDAQTEVRVKCRNNYRHMFKLCGYWQSVPSAPLIINSGAEQWIASALFLAWDRYILDDGTPDKPSLLNLIDSDELYKLLGVTREYAFAQAGPLVDLYESVGHLDRFREGIKASLPGVFVLPPVPEVPEELGLRWLEQEESDGIVERRLVEKKEQKRSRKKAAALKQRYDNTCQFCGIQLEVAENRFYSEAAHIKGLGEPHNGPDVVNNMLVLCPNHHLQFDWGVLRLCKIGAEYQIQSKIVGDPLNGKAITLMHQLKNDYVTYHYDWFN